MKKSLLLFACLFVLISSCKNDEDEVPSRVIFEFTGRAWLGSPEDWWIVLFDNDSKEFIDAKQVFPEETVKFESTKNIPGGNLTVTFLRASTTLAGSNVADVYSDVEVGSKWTFGYRDDPNPGPVTGPIAPQYKLMVTDVPSFFSISVTDPNGSGNFDTSYEDGTILTTVHSGNADQYAYLDIGVDLPRYYKFENLDLLDENQTVWLLNEEFQEADKYVTVTFPEPQHIQEQVLTGGYSHPLDFFGSYLFQIYTGQPAMDPRSEVSFGFLDEISKYYIYVRAGWWTYSSQGSPPTSIEFIDNAGYKATATNFDDYKITTTNDYSDSRASYTSENSNGNTTMIAYYSPKGKERMFDAIPSDLADKYGLDKSAITYSNTIFHKNGRSYTDFLRFTFDSTFDLSVPYVDSYVFGVYE